MKSAVNCLEKKRFVREVGFFALVADKASAECSAIARVQKPGRTNL